VDGYQLLNLVKVITVFCVIAKRAFFPTTLAAACSAGGQGALAMTDIQQQQMCPILKISITK